ncbi:MAG: hypothetical protein ACOYBP_02570 [Microbacteriaceae bacterium]
MTVNLNSDNPLTTWDGQVTLTVTDDDGNQGSIPMNLQVLPTGIHLSPAPFAFKVGEAVDQNFDLTFDDYWWDDSFTEDDVTFSTENLPAGLTAEVVWEDGVPVRLHVTGTPTEVYDGSVELLVDESSDYTYIARAFLAGTVSKGLASTGIDAPSAVSLAGVLGLIGVGVLVAVRRRTLSA